MKEKLRPHLWLIVTDPPVLGVGGERECRLGYIIYGFFGEKH